LRKKFKISTTFTLSRHIILFNWFKSFSLAEPNMNLLSPRSHYLRAIGILCIAISSSLVYADFCSTICVELDLCSNGICSLNRCSSNSTCTTYCLTCAGTTSCTSFGSGCPNTGCTNNSPQKFNINQMFMCLNISIVFAVMSSNFNK
jgi:hypothetical protein